MAVRFYNPGSRIYEKLAFDHPTNDVKQVNLIAYYQIDAVEKDFFEVPTEMTIDAEQGEMTVSVRFADRIQKDYKDYGVVRVNPKAKRVDDDDNVALNEKDAKIKGDRLYRDYLEAKAREHIANVDSAIAFGVVPTRAKGVYAQALKFVGMEDPADKVGSIVNSNRNVGEMHTLQAQLENMQKQIEALTKGK